MKSPEISELLRRRIVADLHLGRLKPGERLPSLRMVATELGVSVRAVARAYSDLERDGLVEVRGRSGIYLIQPHSVDLELQHPFDWYAELLGGAWARRIALTDINEMLTSLVSDPFRVGCVESTEDMMVAFCAELENDFALKTTSVKLTANGARVGDEDVPLGDALANVDFVVTTAFHAAEVCVEADQLQKPIVLVSVNDTLVQRIEQELASRPVSIVAEDPAFVQRVNTYLAERFRENGELRVVRVDDVIANPEVIAGTTALYTRAARRRLKDVEYHLLPPSIPFLSAPAARRIVQCMLSLHAKRLLRVA